MVPLNPSFLPAAIPRYLFVVTRLAQSRPSFHFHQRLTYSLSSRLFLFPFSSSITNNIQIFLAVCCFLFPQYPRNTRYSLFLRPVSHLDCSATRAMLRIRHALITQLNLAMRQNVHLMGLLSLLLSLCHPRDDAASCYCYS